ncbi:MAG: hypothetical protein V7765_08770 [Oleispira sp.]
MNNLVENLDISAVLNSGKIKDWEFNPRIEGFQHKNIDGLEIIRVLGSTENPTECYWKDHCEVKQGASVEYMLKFHEEFICRHYFVEIENINIVLPLPKLGTTEITNEQLNLAKIINTRISVDQLIEQAKFSIQSLFLLK